MLDVEKKYKHTLKACVRAEKIGGMTLFNFNKAEDVKSKRKIRYSENNDLYLNIYEPSEKASYKLPVILYLHGGGWIAGSPEGREAFTTRLASRGFFVVSLFYGLSPKYHHPEPIINAYKAIEWLYENQEKYNIDLSSLTVGGESAGAHLAAIIGAISTNEEYKKLFNLPEIVKDIKINALFLNCGIYEISRVLYSGFKHIKIFVCCYYGSPLRCLKNDEKLIEMSPIYWVTPKYPPSYIITANKDKLADNSFRFIDKLKENNVKYIHFHGKGLLAVHAFPVVQSLKISQEVMDGIDKFLEEIDSFKNKKKVDVDN